MEDKIDRICSTPEGHEKYACSIFKGRNGFEATCVVGRIILKLILRNRIRKSGLDSSRLV
jgi:hypothetical protein